MKLNFTIPCEPGKRIIKDTVTLENVTKFENGDGNVELVWDTENILTTGKWYKLLSEKENVYVLVTNPYFKGAYDLPSFGIAAMVTADNAVIRERSLRFKNVTIEEVDETTINSINSILERDNLHYYDVLGRIKYRPDREDKYWYVKLNPQNSKAEVFCTDDKRTDEDNRRYNNTGNYYITKTEAEAAAKELNNIIL